MIAALEGELDALKRGVSYERGTPVVDDPPATRRRKEAKLPTRERRKAKGPTLPDEDAMLLGEFFFITLKPLVE